MKCGQSVSVQIVHRPKSKTNSTLRHAVLRMQCVGRRVTSCTARNDLARGSAASGAFPHDPLWSETNRHLATFRTRSIGCRATSLENSSLLYRMSMESTYAC